MRAAQATLVLALAAILALAGTAVAQEWESWHQPFSDGLQGARFGMDRFTVSRLLLEKGYQARSGRPGTLRFEGTVAGHEAELLAEFAEDEISGMEGRLWRLRLSWEFQGTSRAVLRTYDQLVEMLKARYGTAVAATEQGRQNLEGGRGLLRRGYRGAEAEALLELQAVRQERYRLSLFLQCPMLEPPEPLD